MRAIAIATTVAITALVFQAAPAHADAVSASTTMISIPGSPCGDSCLEVSFTISNNDKGIPVRRFALIFDIPGVDFTFGPRPTGWHEVGMSEVGGVFEFVWEADSRRTAIHRDDSRSGFKVRYQHVVAASLCPLNVRWTTLKRIGKEIDNGSLSVTCTP